MIDTKTGQTLEHRALCRHPRLGVTWNTSHGDTLCRICQEVGIDPKDPTNKRVEDTNNFHAIRYEDIPLYRRAGISFSKVVCTFLPKTRVPTALASPLRAKTKQIPGDVGTKTASIDLVKILLNRVLSAKAPSLSLLTSKTYISKPL